MGRVNKKEHGMSCSYIVGRYKEAGNIGGEYTNNVLKGIFTKDVCKKLDDLIKDLPSDDSGNGSKDNGGGGGGEGANGANSGSPIAEEGKHVTLNSTFEENGLQAHNTLRAIHGSTDMKLDPTLSEDAELYAKELAKLGHLKHAQLEDVGENLAYGCSSKDGYELSAAVATKRW